MPITFQVDIPEWVEDHELAEYIANNMEDYTDALDHTASEHDDRAVVDDIRVTDVQLTQDSVTINYEVDFSASHGCRDMNYADTDEREIHGAREGRVLTFEKFVYPPPRTTYEEF